MLYNMVQQIMSVDYCNEYSELSTELHEMVMKPTYLLITY